MNEINSLKYEVIYFGGGCFWCTEAVFDRVKGVLEVESGYANGHIPHPTYEAVCEGHTGYAEAVKVVFDPEQITRRDVLEIFFAMHDPTTLNRQGNDVGTQYRSGIYVTTEAQRAEVEGMLQEFDQQKTFGAAVVTELEALKIWWPAESYHQDYFLRNPHQGYCAYVVGPKVQKFLATFARFARDV